MSFVIRYCVVAFFSFATFVQAAPTFADLAVLLAKGQFKEHVPSDSSVEECAAFLNAHGICVSIFDLIDPSKQVAKEDLARVVGQSRLLFLGEAEMADGCIQRPKEVATWVDYCHLNDIKFEKIWGRFVQQTEGGSLPEVDRFFNGQ